MRKKLTIKRSIKSSRLEEVAGSSPPPVSSRNNVSPSSPEADNDTTCSELDAGTVSAIVIQPEAGWFKRGQDKCVVNVSLQEQKKPRTLLTLLLGIGTCLLFGFVNPCLAILGLATSVMAHRYARNPWDYDKAKQYMRFTIALSIVTVSIGVVLLIVVVVDGCEIPFYKRFACWKDKN